MVRPNFSGRSESDEVDQLLLNARLRDELEPFLDEAVELVTVRGKPTAFENEYLASMLAWERAPVLPIARWFQPTLELPHPDSISDEEITAHLWSTIHKLYDRHIALEFTDHLSDRELYCLILRDILPSPEKMLETRSTYLHWHCLDPSTDPETWLRFYASQEEREIWAFETGLQLPPRGNAPYRRKMPRRIP
jgi:hypothetical protein